MNPHRRLSSLPFVGATGAALTLLFAPNSASAEQRPRVQVNQRGDFALIGNTLGWDCGTDARTPLVGTVSSNCGSGTVDSAPDLFWRSDDPAEGQATATLNTTTEQARSTAVLKLPDGAIVTHAFLYWGGRRADSADTTATIERRGVFNENLTATAAYAVPLTSMMAGSVAYQSVADITKLVMTHGNGAYRVSGVDALNFTNTIEEVNFAGWALVVLYQQSDEPPRNLTIFDGLDTVSRAANVDLSLSGFVIPDAGFDAKLGTIVYEGDTLFSGDSLLVGSAPLDDTDRVSDAQNPGDNFFNGTRSYLGMPVSVAGDLPQLGGTADTMAGIDLDVIDVTGRLTPGQTRVDLRATTTFDEFYLGAFITSISTVRPDDDGRLDGTEQGNSCTPPRTNVSDMLCGADGDIGMTTPVPTDADSDAGGVKDGVEDTRHNDAIDSGESDPNEGGGADDENLDSDGDGGVSEGDEDVDHNGAIEDGESDPNQACDDDAARVCSDLESPARARGCSVEPAVPKSTATVWLAGLSGALAFAVRRRKRR